MTNTTYQIIHIASHGYFDEEITHSFLLTYHEKLTMDQLTRLLGTNKRQGRGIDLLTLSACETASGNDRAALGLAGIAIKAGAQSALGSLWPVVDESTALLIKLFYHYLLEEGDNKATALQKAQTNLLKDERYQHPAYWSPFLLIGNWL